MRAVTLLVLSVLVSACAVDGSASPTDHEDTRSARTGLIRTHPPVNDSEVSGMGAIVQGVLEVDLQARCVWLSGLDGARYPIVWPAGTTAQPDPFEVILVDGQVVRHGDQVTGGGGYVPAAGATPDLEPFPAQCLQTGEVAVFNATSSIEVVAGVGVVTSERLMGRFSVPEAIGLELIAFNPDRKSVAVADFVLGTVHMYESSDYTGPSDAIDGISGGGGFIHLWSQGVVYSYPGRIDAEPLVFEPERKNEKEGVASTLQAVPAPDGERVWLVQDGAGFGPTQVELVDLVEVEVTRLGTYEIEGSWQPVGATAEGLVLIANEGSPRTLLVRNDGSNGPQVGGEAISVGWSGVALLDEGSLFVTGPGLDRGLEVSPPSRGRWVTVGGPLIPTTSPPFKTGSSQFLVGLIDEGEDATTGPVQLVVVDDRGESRVIHELAGGPFVATWSRSDEWVAVVGPGGVTLISARGEPQSLGELFPEDHWVLTAG